MLKPVLVRRFFTRSGPAALLLVLWSAVAALAVTLTLFTASYDGANVRVEWEVNSETDVSSFELMRKAASETSYTQVSSVIPTGQRRYQYVDTNVYRTTGGTGTGTAPTSNLGGGPFTYRLTVHSPSGDQSYLTVLAGTPSAVQRSWGTIKSMFR